ncbi:IRE (iron responsive element) [Novipirellula sp. SH528]|uniref:IRE (iron responsive element) n=1 Tax=Novipirellula sp. SH528 TaxID=3454466 RepID=UPI003FA007A2
MNRTNVLSRKLIYLVILLAMVVPLYMLGQPSGGSGDTGGQLTEMRDKFNIAESDLGEISPASETMKLASLGLRGVAATLLWNKAHHYKVLHEWDRLKATLNNIALLQPHFDKVWEHQAHNLAYNVSTEFDDYRQRYEMVREGTEFLSKGVRQNRNAPRLVWYTGWFYGNKMGMSDEKTQFRKLFSEDEVLHESLMQQGIAVDSPEARGPYFKPDNWLVGRLWLMHGYDIVDSGVKIRRQTPLNFFETGPKWRIKHAESIEEEGVLDDRAQNAWQLASEGWREFGERSVPTTAPFTIKLGQLDELVRLKSLRMEEFKKIVGDAASGLNDHSDFMGLAKRADPKFRLQAIELAGEIVDLEERRNKTDGYRKQINYPYWDTLSLAEQEERTVTARRLIYEAEKANEAAELDNAIDLYEQAFAIWAEIFDDYPILTIDDSAEDLMQSIRRYSVAIDSEELPENFPLNAFVEMMAGGREVSSEVYEDIRITQKEKAEERKKELEAEEREREQKAAEEMKAAEEKKKAAEAMKVAEEKKAAEEEKKAAEEKKKEEIKAEEKKEAASDGESKVEEPEVNEEAKVEEEPKAEKETEVEKEPEVEQE